MTDMHADESGPARYRPASMETPHIPDRTQSVHVLTFEMIQIIISSIRIVRPLGPTNTAIDDVPRHASGYADRSWYI